MLRFSFGRAIVDIVICRRVRQFGAGNIVWRNARPGKAQRAAGTQPWSRSREVRFKRRQRSARAAMGNREAMQPRKLDRAEADTVLWVAGSKNQP